MSSPDGVSMAVLYRDVSRFFSLHHFHQCIAHKTRTLVPAIVQGSFLFGVLGQEICDRPFHQPPWPKTWTGSGKVGEGERGVFPTTRTHRLSAFRHKQVPSPHYYFVHIREPAVFAVTSSSHPTKGSTHTHTRARAQINRKGGGGRKTTTTF